MCGICGMLGRGRTASAATLTTMSDRLRHRGPDAAGRWQHGPVGLAMRRLAIIDVAGGDQPISSEDGSLVVVFNGEIYNHLELRRELTGAGHHFKTASDTEVLVHGWEEWAEGLLPRLNGMFAAAIWDGQALHLVRDRLGQKPLFWTDRPGGFYFASEMRALLTVPEVDRAVDPVALHHFLTLQYVPDPRTFLVGVQQLPPGHRLVVRPAGSPRVLRWWRPVFQPKLIAKDGAPVARARSIATRAVKRRLMSEVPLGAFLSGGLDSSIVVGLMAGLCEEPVRTFSIGFPGVRAFDETHWADWVATRFQTDHHPLTFTPTDLVQLAETVVMAQDQPLADPASLPLYELSRQCRAHVTVVLCGDGGDETAAGYPRYVADRILSWARLLPGPATRRLLPALLSRLPEPVDRPIMLNPLAALRRVAQVLATDHRASLVGWGSYFAHPEKLALYTDALREELAPLDTAQLLVEAWEQLPGAAPVDRSLGVDQLTYLPGALLAKTDRMTMAHGLEARAPFLDPEWVTFTAGLPVSWKTRGLETKVILKQAFTDLLPARLRRRRKQGFSLPVGQWFRHELYAWARNRLLSGVLDPWLRPDAVRAVLEEHQAGRVNHGKRLWALVVLATWLDAVAAHP